MPLHLQMPAQLAIPCDWNEAAEHAKAVPEMADAVDYFRHVLGANWSGWQHGSHLARSFHTRIQGDVREWVRLYQLAAALSDVPNCDGLVRNLGERPWNRHIAAEQTLEFCGRLHAAGIRVGLIKPTNNASPDAQLWLDDRPVTTELKALHDPDERMPWNAFEEALHTGLIKRGAHGLNGASPFVIEFYAPALDHTAAVVDALVAIFEARERACRDLPHGSGRARLVAATDPSPGWTIPVRQRDDLARIGSNLRAKWLRQPRAVDGPTVLVVLTQHLFPVTDAHTLGEAHRVADALREGLREHNVPSAILIHEEPFWPPPSGSLHIEDGWRFVLGASEGRYRAALLAVNPSARVSLTATELDQLIGPTMRW
jgi:hypothetical protein